MNHYFLIVNFINPGRFTHIMKTLEQYLQYMIRAKELDPDCHHLMSYEDKIINRRKLRKTGLSQIEEELYAPTGWLILSLVNNSLSLQIDVGRFRTVLQQYGFTGYPDKDGLVCCFPREEKGVLGKSILFIKPGEAHVHLSYSTSRPFFYAKVDSQVDLGEKESYAESLRKYLLPCALEESDIALNIWMHFQHGSHDDHRVSKVRLRDATIPIISNVVKERIPALLMSKGWANPYFNLI